MGEDGNDKRKVKPFHNLNEISHHKIMETASLPFKQQSSLGTSLLGSDSKKISAKPDVPAHTMFTGKTKVKKKMRVEDIITNLTKKVKQVGSTLPKEMTNAPTNESEVKQTGSTPPKDNSSALTNGSKVNPVESTRAKVNKVKKVNAQATGHASTPTSENGRKQVENIVLNANDLSSSRETQEEDGSSFASMCTIRDDPPEYTDLSEFVPLKKQTTAQSGVIINKKTSPQNVILSPKVMQTTPVISNPSTPVKQVILQTVPQKASQQTPIILGKLPPGFIIRSDLPSSSLQNLQTTSASAQPKLLLITKSGGPFYLTQNVNTSTNQTQAKPLNKSKTSPVFTQPKSITGGSHSSEFLKGRPINSNKSILRLASPSKTSTETPLITVQYNLPYPNNNCKVVNNPVNIRTAQNAKPGTFQTLGNIPGTNKVLVTEVPRSSRPREMAVNFAGNQTAHITTMTDEASGIPERQTRFIPTFVYGSPPDTSAINKTKASPVVQKQNDKRIFIVASPSPAAANAKQKISVNKNVAVQSTPRRSIYDEKIAKLNGKITGFNEAETSKAKTSIGLQKKSSVATNNVRVSNRKRQQTEKAKIFEKETKKRKRSEEKSPGKDKREKTNIDAKVKVEKPDDCNITPPKAVSFGKNQSPRQALNKTQSKKSTIAPQQTLNKNDPAPVKEKEKEKEDDPDSLFRDPALLTREQRALQRALMQFKELEEKQARKVSVSETEKKNSRKSEKTDQLNNTIDVQRKRKISSTDYDDVVLKKRRRELKRQSIERKTNEVHTKTAVEKNKDSEVIVKIKQEKNLVSDNPGTTSVHSNENGQRKEIRKKVTISKKTEAKSDTVKDSPSSSKQYKSVKSGKDVTHATNVVKQSPKTPDTVKDSPSSSKQHKSVKSGKDVTHATNVVKQSPKTPDTVKDSPSSSKEHRPLKSVKDVSHATNVVKQSPKTPDSSTDKRVSVKTYMLVPSYHGFKDFSPVVLGSRTRSKKTEPVKADKEDDIPVTKTPEKSEKDIPLLVIETVGNKAVKQDVLANDEELRDLVKNSLRKQGMLKQELEQNEKNQDAEQFENREKRNLTVNRNTGETVLHKASRMGYDETVYHCIQQGSDSNAKDNAGWTPLHEACSRGHSDVVRVLVKYNADVNACSNDGIRPIHDAADHGKIDSLRLLMAYGADPFISTYSGRSVVDCAKRAEAKDYVNACIGDLYLNDERNNIAAVDYENRWDFRGSSSVLDQDRRYLGDIFDNVPKVQSSNSVEFEWSETPHLPTYSLPLVKDGIVVGRKNYILFHDLQERLNKPRQNVIRLLKRTKIRQVSMAEFKKEVSRSFFNKLCECPPGLEEGKVELVPLNWTVRSLLKVKFEHLNL